MIKRLILVLVLAVIPLAVGLLFTYDIVKINWLSFMEVQPSFRTQEDPLPLPAGSVPVGGVVYVEGLDAPANPVPADEVSLQRGKQLYDVACLPCHGAAGEGNGPFSAFLAKTKPANLLDAKVANQSDGAIFVVLSNGIGAMPPMRENLPTARDRWDVVNYVRSLQAAN